MPAYKSASSNIDSQLLALFPSLKATKPSELRKLDCLRALGESQGTLSAKEISKISGASLSATKRILSALVSLSLISKNAGFYRLESKGIVALMSMTAFQSFSRVRPLLISLRNDDLAFAMLIIGHSRPPSTSDAVTTSHDALLYTTLSGYSKYGHNIESLDGRTAADSILRYFGSRARTNSKSAPPYLDMFKDFTPAGVQDILKMLVVAVRPTPDDYNWLIQFFHELVNFYYNPIRMAYISMLANGDPVMINRLNNYKREQETLMKNDGGNVELTFKLAGGLEKFANMPPQLRAMGFKLVLEPLRFMGEELEYAFWPPDKQNNLM
jgi:hypothetical protein